jgi:hypothetical protein
MSKNNHYQKNNGKVTVSGWYSGGKWPRSVTGILGRAGEIVQFDKL